MRAGGIALAILCAAPLAGAGAAGACLDREAWGRVLSAHTAQVKDVAGVRVDYAALRHSADWSRVLASLVACRPEELRTRKQRLAFWIDAYNALAIDVVVRHYPLKSIRDVGSLLRPVWKREAGTIGGRAYSLDEIEHAILRPLGEPRIHAAIVCASLSCPPLRREPFHPDRLEAQLDDQLRAFLADPRKGARLEGDTLWLSRIFDWFADDFAAAGGVLAFVRPHLPSEIRERLPAAPRLRFLDYDWGLNDLR